MDKDLYLTLGKELRVLLRELKGFDKKKNPHLHQHMDPILTTAKKIGGPILQEAEQLNAALANFLNRPNDLQLAVVKEHALRLEQETRDL